MFTMDQQTLHQAILETILKTSLHSNTLLEHSGWVDTETAYNKMRGFHTFEKTLTFKNEPSQSCVDSIKDILEKNKPGLSAIMVNVKKHNVEVPPSTVWKVTYATRLDSSG